MRIIAGKYRSRIIKMPKGVKIRPTKDKVRESLFNIIDESVQGAIVLDAFAGSGAFGIEALSRRAERVVFIENDRRCVETIKKNLKSLSMGDSDALILEMDAFKAFTVLEDDKEKFDIVLFDPPYHKDLAKKCLIKLDSCDILTTRCIIIAEHHKKDILPKALDNITSFRVVCYGDICLSFYGVKSKDSGRSV